MLSDYKLLFIGFVLLATSSCKKDEAPEFDRKAMLENMALNVIIPSYLTQKNSIQLLAEKSNLFITTPSVSTLQDLKSQFLVAYKHFQHCGMYNFGPAGDYGIKAAFNTFPTDTGKIETNIAAGSYTLESAVNSTAIGFPSIDYLLFFGSESEVVNKFSLSQNRKNYLNDVLQKMKNEIDLVYNQWNSTYKTNFINADGNDANSSCSYLVNEFAKEIDLIKGVKIGIPAGQQTGGMLLPNFVEAYWSGYTKVLLLENIAGLKNAFLGASGKGLDDYIRDVESENTVPSLADNIVVQMEICTNKTNSLAETFSDQITTNTADVIALYNEVKKLLVYCKTDMTSMLGILITYQDNDGD